MSSAPTRGISRHAHSSGCRTPRSTEPHAAFVLMPNAPCPANSMATAILNTHSMTREAMRRRPGEHVEAAPVIALLRAVACARARSRRADLAPDLPSRLDVAAEVDAGPHPRFAELLRPGVVARGLARKEIAQHDRRRHAERGRVGRIAREGRLGITVVTSGRTGSAAPSSSGTSRPGTRSSPRSGRRARARTPAQPAARSVRPSSASRRPTSSLSRKMSAGLALLAELPVADLAFVNGVRLKFFTSATSAARAAESCAGGGPGRNWFGEDSTNLFHVIWSIPPGSSLPEPGALRHRARPLTAFDLHRLDDAGGDRTAEV